MVILMRKLNSLILLFLVLLLAGKELLWLSSFQLLKQQIADKWCINKFDAELMCGGRCYLFQQLEEWNEANEHPTSLRISRLTPTPLYLTPKTSAFSNDLMETLNTRNLLFRYQGLRHRLFIPSLFVPPEILA